MGQFDFLFGNAREVPLRQQAFIANYPFPRAARDKFARRHLQLSSVQVERVFEALRQYFLICHDAGQNVISMPSRVVDDAWHEFILFTHDYHEFCEQAFGRYFHHTPSSALDSPIQEHIGRKLAWSLACKREGINPLAPAALPLLFALDSQLNIADGFFYTPEMLAALMQNRHPQRGSDGGTNGGAGCGGGSSSHSPADCDSGTASGCGDGGGGDGGSCGGGGGCGGGGCGGG